MSKLRLIVGAVAASLVTQVAVAQSVQELLVERATFWEQRKDWKRAEDSWKKLLQVAPDNPQALAGIASASLHGGNRQAANRYLSELKRAHPDSPLIAQIEQEINLTSPESQVLIEQANQAAESADIDSAVEKYQQALGTQKPVGSVGRDYYTLLGYTEDRLPEAIDNLRKLHAQAPQDAQLELALSRHLSRRAESRTEGITRLEKLSQHPEVGREATESWREVLTWLGPPSPKDVTLFETYLERHPSDKEVRELYETAKQRAEQVRRDSLRKPADPLTVKLNNVLHQVEQGNTRGAREEFEMALKQRPNDSNALGGLGLLAMRSGDWQEATQYLTRARRGHAGWQAPLNEARYWLLIDRSRNMIKQGDLAGAEKTARQAQRLSPKDSAANLVLAEVDLEQGNVERAIDRYRTLLKDEPSDQSVAFGLGRALVKTGNHTEALELLEAAFIQNPDNPWIRYELAQVYKASGRASEAERLLSQLTTDKYEGHPDVLHVRALIAADREDWPRVQQLLDGVPAQERTASMNSLYSQANRTTQVGQAIKSAREGKRLDAVRWLEELAQKEDASLGDLETIAQAYVEIGEPERGLALINPLRKKQGAAGVNASIAYANLLVQAGRDVDASLLLQQLEAGGLSGAQRARVTQLEDGFRVRKADQLRERGDIVAAYDTIAPILKARPNDVAAKSALARMYASSGEFDKAFAIYDDLLLTNPADSDVHLGLALLAQQAGNDGKAIEEAKKAVQLAPDSSKTLTAAAKVARDSGRPGTAMDLLEEALRHQSQPLGTQTSASVQQELSGEHNPFTNRQAPRVASAELQKELEALYEARSATITVSATVRNRNGDSGLSQLTEVGTSLEAKVPYGDGHFSFTATPVFLDAGGTGDQRSWAWPRKFARYDPLAVADETQSGVGFALGYAMRGLNVDVGVTPVGFEQVNFTGGALFEGKLDSEGSVGYRLDISRRPVKDSMLSYAGRRSDVLGRTWGGVMATGARLTLSKDLRGAGLYGSLAWHHLAGENVATNHRTEINIGSYFRMLDEENTKLTGGVNLNATYYQRNLSHFTYGSGGYFSPQHYYEFAFPVMFAHRNGPLSLRLDGSLGVQQFKEKDAPIFPFTPNLQAQAMSTFESNSVFARGYYRGQSKTGVSYSLRGAAEYRFSPHVLLGGAISTNNAQDFREWNAGVYLRYYFYPQRTARMALPMEPYNPTGGDTYGR